MLNLLGQRRTLHLFILDSLLRVYTNAPVCYDGCKCANTVHAHRVYSRVEMGSPLHVKPSW